jgi:uncharacterized membrane protein YedE/YeeE
MILRGSTEMTVFEDAPTLRTYAGMRLAMWASKRAKKAQSKVTTSRVTALVNATVRVLLHIAGFALLTIAAWQWNIIAGLAVAGISCFVLSTLMTGGTATGETEDRGDPHLRQGR